MPTYMLQGKNNAKSWDARIYHPAPGRGDRLAQLWKGLNVKVIADYFTSGPMDFLLIVEVDSKIDAHALARAMMACGMLTEDPLITELLTLDEYSQMLKRAAEVRYPPPYVG